MVGDVPITNPLSKKSATYVATNAMAQTLCPKKSAPI